MLVAWSIVRTVRDWLEPTGFAHIVSVFGLALAIFGALLVPVDLYNVASLSDSMTGQLVDQDERQEVVEHAALIVVLYQVVFLSLCGFLFVLLPLAYFWSEAAVQQPDAPPARAALHAAGFASCFAVIAGLIGLLGTAIQPVAPPPQLENEAWAMQLLQVRLRLRLRLGLRVSLPRTRTRTRTRTRKPNPNPNPKPKPEPEA